MAKAEPYHNSVNVYVDGASRGNPGDSGCGAVVKDPDGNELGRDVRCIGHSTNNRAEYQAIIRGLRVAARHTRGDVRVVSDSELVVKQLNGQYRVKVEELQDLFTEVRQLEGLFQGRVVYSHVKRTNRNIQEVDRAVNEALDGR